jgi:putative endonuclease
MRQERQYFVYILASKPYGTLYVGVTNNIARRVFEHREGLVDGFTKQYGIKTLVYFESFAMAAYAIQREKRIKKWPRQHKVNLIMASNPRWEDLYEGIIAT